MISSCPEVIAPWHAGVGWRCPMEACDENAEKWLFILLSLHQLTILLINRSSLIWLLCSTCFLCLHADSLAHSYTLCYNWFQNHTWHALIPFTHFAQCGGLKREGAQGAFSRFSGKLTNRQLTGRLSESVLRLKRRKRWERTAVEKGASFVFSWSVVNWSDTA